MTVMIEVLKIVSLIQNLVFKIVEFVYTRMQNIPGVQKYTQIVFSDTKSSTKFLSLCLYCKFENTLSVICHTLSRQEGDSKWWSPGVTGDATYRRQRVSAQQAY